MKRDFTNNFPIKKVIPGFITLIFLLPTGTLQSGNRSDTNKVAIGKTKTPFPVVIEENEKQHGSGFENNDRLLQAEKKAGGKNGNWMLPPVVVLIYLGKKKSLKGVCKGIGKLIKNARLQMMAYFRRQK